MNSPLFDQNSIVAIETAFRNGSKDPFWEKLLIDFTNLYVYSDAGRFPMPLKDQSYSESDIEVLPELLQKLILRDKDFFLPIKYYTTEPETLKKDYLENCFCDFSDYLKSKINIIKLKEWLQTHKHESVTYLQNSQIASQYTFDVESLKDKKCFQSFLKELNYDIQNKCKFTDYEICYAFDHVLRYSKYGKMVGNDEYYLSHPLRSEINIKTINNEILAKNKAVPIYSFGTQIAKLSRNMSLDEYSAILILLKEEIWKNGIHLIKNKNEIKNQVFYNILQNIASKVGFPAHLKPNVKKIINISSGIATGAGAFIPGIGTYITIGGALVTIVNNVWDEKIAKATSKIQWLKWAFDYEI